MRIPEVQDRLWELARILDAPELAFLAHELYRRKATHRAPAKANGMTMELRGKIRAFAVANPDMPHREIGAEFGVDGGRVSEALYGKRQ